MLRLSMREGHRNRACEPKMTGVRKIAAELGLYALGLFPGVAFLSVIWFAAIEDYLSAGIAFVVFLAFAAFFLYLVRKIDEGEDD